MNGVWLVVPMAWLVGSSIGAAVGAPARPWFVATVAGLVAFEVLVARRVLASGQAGRGYLRYRRLEFWLLLVGMRLLQAVTGGAGGLSNPSPVDRETIWSAVVLLVVRASVNATFDDLGAVDRALETAEGSSPVARIRLRVVGYAVLVTVASGFAAVRIGGFFDLTRGPEPTMALTPIWFIALALPALAMAALRAERGVWARDGAVVDDRTAASWLRRAWAVTALVIIATVAVWLSSAGASGLGAAGIVRSGPVGAWIVDRLAAIGDTDVEASERGEGETVDPASQFDTGSSNAPEWLGEAMLWLIAIGVISWAAARGRRAARLRRDATGDATPIRIRDVLREIWQMLLDLIWSLRRLLARASARVRSGRPSSVGTTSRSVGSWNPDDQIRRRIARSYRRAGRAVAPDAGARARTETMREYAQRVADVAPPQAEDVAQVTDSYEEARFSTHHLGEPDASRAERAADRVERRSGDDGAGR